MHRVPKYSWPKHLFINAQVLLRDLWEEITLILVSLKNRTSSWKLRRVSHRVLDLMANDNLSADQRADLRRLTSEMLLHSKVYLEDLLSEKKDFLRTRQPQIALLSKLLRGMRILETTNSQDMNRFGRALQTFAETPTAALASDLKMRTLIVSSAKFGQALSTLEQICQKPLDNSQLIKKIGPIFLYFADAESTLKALRHTTLWNSRMILFHTRKGMESLDPDLSIIQSFSRSLKLKYLHVALLSNQVRKSIHCWHITFHKLDCNRVSDAEMITSDILELKAEKLLLPHNHTALAKALGLDQASNLASEVNRRLERSIDQLNLQAQKLDLKNSFWSRMRTPLRFATDHRGMRKGSILQKGQTINCAHYVSSVLFRAVEEVNEELSAKLQRPERVLRPIIHPRFTPSGILLDRLFDELKKVSDEIQVTV